MFLIRSETVLDIFVLAEKGIGNFLRLLSIFSKLTIWNMLLYRLVRMLNLMTRTLLPFFFATNTYHYPNTDTNSTSENLCKFWLTDILNTLAPFLQERKTNFKTVIFSFCKEKADDSRYGYTTYQLNDLVIITFNMTKLKSKDLFCNVAIHEIVHMLTPFEGYGNNFYHTYICVLRILSTSLRNVTLFPASTFLSPSL